MDEDQPALVVVAAQLLDRLARGCVPATDDDVISESGRAHTLPLFQQEIDDHRNDRACDKAEHEHAQHDQADEDEATARTGSKTRTAAAQNRGDCPEEGCGVGLEADRVFEDHLDECCDGDDHQQCNHDPDHDGQVQLLSYSPAVPSEPAKQRDVEDRQAAGHRPHHRWPNATRQ
jgi:hypothetical protein